MWHETNTEIQGRDATVHGIELTPTTFREAYNKTHVVCPIKVNSLHHQCVSCREFPDELEVLGLYKGKDSKITSIEVLRHRTLSIYGVQYHPEELIVDPLGDYIMELLISKSKNYATT
jgi:gamma-glutamyl-gamma-aminobutyrate hydrolase PuuD